MEKSTEIADLAKALVAFQSKCKTIGYDANNPFFRSKYATLTALVSETRKDLTAEGLSVTQLCEDEGSITTMLMHTTGQYISSKLTLKPVKDDPQGRGSCLTYSRRYAYAAILGLVSDDDDDANAASKPPEIKQKVTTLKDRVEGTGIAKFKSRDKFIVWLVDNDIDVAFANGADEDLNKILEKIRNAKVS